MMLVPELVTVRLLSICGWQTVRIVRLHQTVEWPREAWRAHLEAVFEAAEGRRFAAVERQKET